MRNSKLRPVLVGDSFFHQLFTRLIHMFRGLERIFDFRIYTMARYSLCSREDQLLVADGCAVGLNLAAGTYAANSEYLCWGTHYSSSYSAQCYAMLCPDVQICCHFHERAHDCSRIRAGTTSASKASSRSRHWRCSPASLREPCRSWWAAPGSGLCWWTTFSPVGAQPLAVILNTDVLRHAIGCAKACRFDTGTTGRSST